MKNKTCHNLGLNLLERKAHGLEVEPCKVKLHELVNLICDQPASWSAVVILEVVIGEEGDQGLVRYYFTILLTKS